MPWMECCRMTLRQEFVRLAQKENSNVSMLCKRFGISRKTGYKWLERYESQGVNGLNDQSRRPIHSPNKTSYEIEKMILAIRKKHCWCGRKIWGYLQNKGVLNVPSPSTITMILKRSGQISDENSKKAEQWTRFEREAPMDLIQMDFKGHFPTMHERCHPLTVIDDHSRYCLCLQACTDEKRQTVKNHLTDVFRQYGLPLQINVDNGPPWGAKYFGDYTQLSMWLIRLGIVVTYSAPLHPQTNGKIERFHRTLKAEVLQGRIFNGNKDAQISFDKWRYMYNFERPHDGLENSVPADRYKPSSRAYPEVMPAIEYSPDDIVRKVDNYGRVSFLGFKIRITKALKGEYVAFRPTNEDGKYKAYYVRQNVKDINLKELT
jgi:transposase InsO family protein